jgi:hypothetical protein
VTPTPIASFLAGSLLTILLPLAVFVALIVWYALFLRRAPDSGLGRSSAEAGGAGETAAPPERTGIGEGASGASPPPTGP